MSTHSILLRHISINRHIETIHRYRHGHRQMHRSRQRLLEGPSDKTLGVKRHRPAIAQAQAQAQAPCTHLNARTHRSWHNACVRTRADNRVVLINSLFSCHSQPGIRACVKARTRQHTRQSAHLSSANTSSNAPESPSDFRLKIYVQRGACDVRGRMREGRTEGVGAAG